ncbi:helix-turn-helix domain-containing protein [Streptococcus suis]|uniref:Helix-turn-helix transcriptional regulator n=1 Tax=Streptococcus suis TaxID=1307 RepID=A0A540UPE6_STRSU|nr:helix-turn-helix transcriptional regulator [Streptococcus suis]MCK4024539.1 helix-turn-helix transcriptional regulator [Streptococcus suis]NQJ66647.1 helix-turn-helix transcriptional regulator [Streptococcus suis]TQE86374.1 helix-turn-helix transcriptional regulator [Streptococcus suis]HEL2460624.1 helix-turn-helix transcriptional regulator [Streptococcus suis]HEM4765468.1 helix-turn-helix transcriptional regulator [Streptococcus suis]
MKQYPLQEHITNRIRYLRQEKKLSQEQLSEKAELGTNYIHNVEKKSSNIKVETLEKIMEALSVTPDQFFNFQISEASSEAREVFEAITQLPQEKQTKVLQAIRLLLETIND